MNFSFSNNHSCHISDNGSPTETNHRLATAVFSRLFSCNLALLFILLLVIPLQAQQIDLLLKGGHVIDPKNEIDAPMDVAIADGKILQVSENISADNARRVIDATGLYVTPGLIDMHAHVFHGTEEQTQSGFEITNSFGSVVPDGFTFRSGVTTIVDAGSSGWRNFEQFKKQTIDNSQTRVLAIISIVGHGMLGTLHAQNLDDMNPVATAFKVSEHPGLIVGVKKHHYQGPDFTPVERAVEAGEIAGVPVMVDFGGHMPPLSLETLLMEKLRPGDMLTHTFYSSPRREGGVDDNGRVKPFIFDAKERGILFDLGHGAGGFQWVQAIPAVEQGFLPDILSTDLYYRSMNGGMKDISNIMSKFMNIGLSLQDVVLRTTWNPAQAIQREDLGHLSEGAEADVSVFGLREGDFGFMDARRTTIRGTRKLEPELTIKAGRVMWDLNGRAAPMWDE
ncbi:MAG: amidohydrolase/deacetylase family metallohydrolase [Balneolales bacterium]